MASSSLAKNLLDLERDFKYNLNLLKIREEEIERCDRANREIGEKLLKARSEIDLLSAKIAKLEVALEKSENERIRVEKISKQSIDKLRGDIESMRRDQKLTLKEHLRELKEIEAKHSEILNEKEETHKGSLNCIQKRLEKETENSKRLRQELQELINENMSLRNQIRSAESKHTLESSYYENEMKSIRKERSNFVSQTEHYKNTITKLESELIVARQKVVDFKGQLRTTNDRITEVTDTKKVIESDNKKLQKKVIELEELNKDLQDELTKTSTQNKLLQEIIKKLRKQRQNPENVENPENIAEAESRLDKLEELLLILKRSLQETSTEIHVFDADRI